MGIHNQRQPTTSLAGSVFHHYGAALHRYLFRRLRSAQNVRDLEQEVYLRLVRVVDSELVRDPKAYMYRIASHVVYEFKQRAQDELVSFDSEAVDELGERPQHLVPDPLAEQLSAERELERVLMKLPPKLRAAFILHMRDGLTHAEVAEKLDLSVHTVKKQMFKAFLTLRGSAQARQDER